MRKSRLYHIIITYRIRKLVIHILCRIHTRLIILSSRPNTPFTRKKGILMITPRTWSLPLPLSLSLLLNKILSLFTTFFTIIIIIVYVRQSGILGEHILEISTCKRFRVIRPSGKKSAVLLLLGGARIEKSVSLGGFLFYKS